MSRILTRSSFPKIALPLLLSLFSFSAGAWEFCANADPKFLGFPTKDKANTWIQVENGSVLCIVCKGTATPSKARTNCNPVKTCQKDDSKGGCATKYTRLAERISTHCLKNGDTNGTESRCAKSTAVAETKSAESTKASTKTAKSSGAKKGTTEASGKAEAPANTEVAAKPASPGYAPSIRTGVTEQKANEKPAGLAKMEPKLTEGQIHIREKNKAEGLWTDDAGDTYRTVQDIKGNWVNENLRTGIATDYNGNVAELPKSGMEFLSADGKTTYKDRAEWIAAGGTSGGKIVDHSDGSTIYYDSKGNPDYKTDKDGKIVARNEALNKDPSKLKKIDQCAKSQAIDSRFTCDGTYSVTKLTDIGNQVLSSSGRNVINQLGTTAAQRAQTGRSSDTFTSSAKMAKTGFTYETMMSAANLAAASNLGKKASKHSKNIAEMQSGALEQAQFEGGLKVDPGNTKTLDTSKDYQGAIQEQTEARNTARDGVYKATMVGIASMANAILAKKNQQAMEKAAKTQRQIEAKTEANAVIFNGGGMAAAVAANGTSMDQLEGEPNSGTDPDSITTNTDNTQTTSSGSPSLGSGTDPGAGDDSGPKQLAAGKFKPSEGGGGSGGAGGGGVGGGGSGGGSGAPISTEESKAQYAAEFGTKERYESGGTPGAGGKGKGAGGKEDGGIDLNGLLAQFLPKDETDMGPKNGILDYQGFGGGRAPAAEEAPSYLDKNADLFQRIHETMSEKNRKGHVGI